MANMSYCRFHNTLQDLNDCYEALCNEEELSQAEAKERDRLIKLCITIAKEFGDETFE